MKVSVARRAGLALQVLAFLSWGLTGLGVLTAAALKTEYAANLLLSWNPRYHLAMDGLRTLEDFKYPI